MQKTIKIAKDGSFAIFMGEKLINTRCQLDYQIHIVGLDFCLVCRLVAHLSSASLASMDYDKSALCVGQRHYRTENAAALVLSVAGIYIHVQRG